MLVDYHTCHYRYGLAEGQLAEYVEAAIEAGLHEIGYYEIAQFVQRQRHRLPLVS